ncbi:sterol desaturase family protein [Pseudomonas putida]|uniref:Sterol desaturase family protein n=1 Tax=Pseudomonas putida TaxID=303 RepID=A0ABD7BHD4_PSEPU|nr:MULTISPECIES: sterol desaturase family protein [Pseudomonas]MBH3450679.1 sterol desaturase family protein [Pseudomonas putida]QOD00066.1 sterol desaturase family protein [Pseudomonas putida]
MRTLYAPLFFFGYIAAALSLADHPLWLLPLLASAVLLSFTCERLIPYKAAWNQTQGDGRRDLCHALINECLTLCSVAAIPLLAHWLPGAGFWPDQWPLALQLLLAIALADLGITLVHYASHRSPLLWRLHAVHHSVTRLYGFNGLMKHPLHQLLETLGGTLPLLLLGLPVDVAALLAFSVSIQLLLQHSNVDMRIGGLRHVFAWAPVHRLHHLKYGRTGDVNFALFFPLWDRLLGTLLYLPGYALADDDMGIGDRPDYPQAYLAQLREPWVSGEFHPPALLPVGLRQALAERTEAQVTQN